MLTTRRSAIGLLRCIEYRLHPWYPAHILVASKGERIPIGSFLTQEEKNTLVERLREIINQLSS